MGRPLMDAAQEQQRQINQLRRQAAVQGTLIDYIARLAGVSDHVAAIRKKADAENPAQPVPNPPSEQPYETTEQAVAPEAYDNVQAPGQTPGSVQHLPADTTGTPMDPGTTLPTAPFNELQQVTAPVAGTETQLPLNQTRTEVDVRVGDPMGNLQTAFPWQLDGGGQRAAARQAPAPVQPQGSSARTMASLRLARLQIEAGISDGVDDDLSVAASIETDASRSDDDIAKEISLLAKVKKSASANTARSGGHLVPRSAGVRRTSPSLAAQASLDSNPESVSADVADADLFD